MISEINPEIKNKQINKSNNNKSNKTEFKKKFTLGNICIIAEPNLEVLPFAQLSTGIA